MRTGKNRFYQVGSRARSTQGKKRAASIGRAIVHNMLILGIAVLFSMALTTYAWASNPSGAADNVNLDARWLPWIGSWRLVSDTEDTVDSALKDQYLLTTSPGDSGKSIILTGYRADQVLFEEKIEADGLRHPIEKDDCTGWQLYDWSGTGKRLLFQGGSDCTGDLQQAISGISIIDGNGDWLDIQLLQSEEEKTITIRRYRNVDADTIAPGRTNVDSSRVARVYAGSSFSIDEIIELSGKVESEVLEAALVELHKPFPINSKQILRLADAGVPTRIVDLMVALSFPDEFVVEEMTISRVQKIWLRPVHADFWPYDSCWYCGHPFFPGLCSASMYYDYWYLDRYYWPGWYHNAWWYPGYSYGVSGYGVRTGRLVKGQGYTQVYPDNGNSAVRYAQPRNAPAGQGVVSQQVANPSYSTSSSTYSTGSSTGSSSTYTYPTASPSGYSSGSSSTTETSDYYQ